MIKGGLIAKMGVSVVYWVMSCMSSSLALKKRYLALILNYLTLVMDILLAKNYQMHQFGLEKGILTLILIILKRNKTTFQLLMLHKKTAQ